MANLDDVADAMLRHESPVVTAGDLADDLDVTSRHVLDLLRLLERAGEVESKDVGARAVAWWHEERVCGPRLPPEDHPAQSDLRDHEADAGGPERDVGREPTDDRDEQGGDLDADLEALDLPGAGGLLNVRREAVRGCYELLRREGTASRSDFIEQVYESDEFDRAGYETSAGWWNTIGKKGLRGLAERRDDVAAPSEGAHQWRFIDAIDG